MTMKRNSNEEPLRICILACVFWPIYPGYGGAQHFVTAQALASLGYNVNVVTTFPIGPGSKRSFKFGLIAREQLNGIKIIRVPAFRPSGPGLGRKFMFYLSFALTSLTALAFIRKADVILGLDPPAPFLVPPGFLFSRLLRAKYIIRVTDLWPDVLFEFDIVKSKLARKVATSITTMAYRIADHIIAFAPKIKPGITKYGIPDEKISIIELAVDTALFRPMPDARNQAVSLGFPSPDNRFVVLYSGAFALTYDFDTLLKAAKILESFQDILFALLGDGDARDHIKEKTAELELKNVIMLPPVSKSELVAQYINCSDVCVVPLKPEMVTSMITRPSKTFEFWACGKPVIACSKDELAALIEQSQAGIALEPGEPEALAKAIEFLNSSRDVATDMGEKGRQFVLDNFSYQTLAANLEKTIGRLCSN